MKSLLDNIGTELKERLFALGHRRVINTESIIFDRGETPDLLPIIISGSVKMIRMPEPGKEVIIGTFHAGEMFAVPPVFDGEPYPSTAIATERTELLQVRREDFLSLICVSPEFAFEIISWTCDMLREKTSMIRTLSTTSPEHRVGRVLLKLFAESGEGIPVRIAVRRQDIAEMASLSTETTIRVIRRFAAQGLVRIVHGKIFIDSVAPLQELLGN